MSFLPSPDALRLGREFHHCRSSRSRETGRPPGPTALFRGRAVGVSDGIPSNHPQSGKKNQGSQYWHPFHQSSFSSSIFAIVPLRQAVSSCDPKATGLWHNSLARPQQRQTRALMRLPSIRKHGSAGRRTRAQHQQPAKSQDSLPPNWKPLDSKTKSPHCFTPLELYFTTKRSANPELVFPSSPP